MTSSDGDGQANVACAGECVDEIGRWLVFVTTRWADRHCVGVGSSASVAVMTGDADSASCVTL